MRSWRIVAYCWLFEGFVGIVPTTAWTQPPAYSLRDLYTHALQQSERIVRSTEEIEFARARFGTARSSALPRVHAKASEFLQDPMTTGNAFSDSFTRLSRPEVALSLSQPLFSGLKEWYGLQAARAYQEQSAAALEDARRRLFGDVSTVFYTLARLDQAIRTTERIVAVLQLQQDELSRAVELGKSRRADMAIAAAELAMRQADLEMLRGERGTAAEAMTFLTGLDRVAVTAPSVPRAHYTLEQYLALAQRRADVRAAQAASQVATNQMKAVRADFWPKADLTANYYPHRVGFQSDIKWDLQFNLSVPLTPVKEYHSWREAKVRARQEASRTRETAAQATTELRTLYRSHHAAVQQYRRYTTAAQKTEESYDLYVEDYHHGLIDLFQLLDVERRWFEALQARDTARIHAAVTHTQLELAAEVLP